VLMRRGSGFHKSTAESAMRYFEIGCCKTDRVVNNERNSSSAHENISYLFERMVLRRMIMESPKEAL